MHLDDVQHQAATWGDGPCLTLAGPGAGKTTVLVNRILYLLREAEIPPEQILVITFTRDAALEMKTRFLQKSGETGQKVTFGTFHSVFFFMLRRSFGYQYSDLLTGKKKMDFLKHCLSMANYPFVDDSENYRKVMQELSSFATSGKAISDYLPRFFSPDFLQVIQIYEEEKNREDLLDFDDLMKQTKELFLKNPSILNQYRKRYPYLLVDEVQDMNPIQFEIMALLAAPLNNLFAVGDDDQSIYGFRNASPDLMLKFPEIFPNCRIIRMNRNYRSNYRIVEMAGNLIQHNKKRYPKEILAVKEERGHVICKSFPDQDEEAVYVREMLENLPENKSVGILFRNRSHGEKLRQELFWHHIPFTYPEEKKNPYSHFIFYDFESYLWIACGSSERSNYLRIMNRPVRYIPRVIFERDQVTRSHVLRAADSYLERPKLGGMVRSFFQELDFLSTLPAFAFMNYIYRGLDYKGFLREYAASHGEDPKEYEQILELLFSLSQKAKSKRELLDRILELRRIAEEQLERNQKNTNKGALGDEGIPIAMSTFHGAKGLEFDWVYILNAVEGAVPSKKAESEAEIEEERRMFYVAVTRAKECLTICTAITDNKKLRAPSRFLREMGSSQSLTAAPESHQNAC